MSIPFPIGSQQLPSIAVTLFQAELIHSWSQANIKKTETVPSRAGMPQKIFWLFVLKKKNVCRTGTFCVSF